MLYTMYLHSTIDQKGVNYTSTSFSA